MSIGLNGDNESLRFRTLPPKTHLQKLVLTDKWHTDIIS